ncbi:hypothetical protein [Aromatoleum diolicum]|uniref:Uncharacterized protein n=1 Tax=Aromatoleum diolicum TaxID=75796 RepID=A0ABX1QJ88_9RHOO|nr:hypothetical protein [Aromatoleum diolicum]NMG77216.1 hypothetical protein [Aromatoleum diolicum]
MLGFEVSNSDDIVLEQTVEMRTTVEKSIIRGKQSGERRDAGDARLSVAIRDRNHARGRGRIAHQEQPIERNIVSGFALVDNCLAFHGTWLVCGIAPGIPPGFQADQDATQDFDVSSWHPTGAWQWQSLIPL